MIQLVIVDNNLLLIVDMIEIFSQEAWRNQNLNLNFDAKIIYQKVVEL